MFSDVLNQVTNLFRTEVKLAKTEISEKINHALMAAGFIVAGAVLLIGGLYLFLQWLVMLLVALGLAPLWATLIVAVVAGRSASSSYARGSATSLRPSSRRTGRCIPSRRTPPSRRSKSDDNATTPSSRDVEREADQKRAELSSTLEQLRDKLTPGQIVDDMLAGSSVHASKFLSNLGTTVRDHPVPALLIGAGLAMMMTGTPSMPARSAGRNRAATPATFTTMRRAMIASRRTAMTATRARARRLLGARGSGRRPRWPGRPSIGVGPPPGRGRGVALGGSRPSTARVEPAGAASSAAST